MFDCALFTLESFLKILYFIDYAISCPIFPPRFPSALNTLSHPRSPPLQFMPMGHTDKFFGFYISYTILTLPLSIFYLPFMLLILCTSPPPPPTPLLITLHVISISEILSCSSCLLSLLLFLFQVWLLITVSLLSFLLFTFFIFFFLGNSL